MMFEEENTKKGKHAVQLGADLSTFSLEDIDDLVGSLEAEITRLKEERVRKSKSLSAAESFFSK